MKKMFYVQFLTATAMLFVVNFASAQGEVESSKLTFSGSADVYFRTNLTAKNGEGAQAPATSFANLPGFSLGMFNLIGSYEGEKIGFVGDLVFGPRGQDAVFASFPSNNIVNQLYMYWNVNDKVTLTMGNFNTFLGYEVISPTSNFNYSTSYMFSYGPFSHSGLKADFSLSDDATLMLGIFNPTDLTDFNPLGTYTLGAQLDYKGVYLNLLYGDQDGRLNKDEVYEDETASLGALFQVDLTAGFDVTEDLYVGVNATYNSVAPGEVAKGNTISNLDGDTAGFYGVAAYLQYKTSDAFALGLRGEYFGEMKGGYGIIGAYNDEGAANIFGLTLSGNISIGELKLIPELRVDMASQEIFVNASSKSTKSLASFLLAAVYSF
jgi:hypothetical protein